MSETEFSAYVVAAVADFAGEKVASGQWSKGDSLRLAKEGLDELLPLGLATPDHHLFTLRDPAMRSGVGMLWFAVQQRAGEGIAYVYDVLVESKHRRMGYTTLAFAALEAEVRSRGRAGIALHVFGHNAAARALYDKLGYRPTNINLFKKLRHAGD